MNEKKQSLLKSGMRLFAQKGYYQTSIQEIAADAGVSKGTFYIYFQSKEDFISTVFTHFYTQIKERLEQVSKMNVKPRRNLANQIAELTEYIYKYKDLITISLRENISIGENTDKIIEQMKLQNFYWLRDNVLAIYGNVVEDILVDIIIQLEGLMNGYFKWIVMDNLHIDKQKIGEFIVRRLDDIVQGMLTRKEGPMVRMEHVPGDYDLQENKEIICFHEVMETMKSKVLEADLDALKISKLCEVCDALKIEAGKAEPSSIIIQGLLAHFANFSFLRKESEQLANIFEVELIK